MTLFRFADKKFQALRYQKTEENESVVEYTRTESLGYTHKICIIRKEYGYDGFWKVLVQSYDPNLFDEKKIGNTNVGLTEYEMKLCIRKIKELGW